MLSPRSRFLLIFLVMILTMAVGCSNQQDLTRPSTDSLVTWDKAAPSGYYDTVDTSSPAAMRASLHDIIDDGIKIPYTATSTDTWDVEEAACEDPNDAGKILDIYKNASYPKYGGGNDYYNREHVWAKSYGFPNDSSTNYPYTDCHHLFLCDSGYNSARSNKPFRNADASATEEPTLFNNGVGGGTSVYPGNSNWTSGSFTQGTWEVWGDRRGDIARALFYMDVRYEGGVHPGTSNPEPDLILTDDEALIEASNTGNNESVAYMGMLSVLLQWNQEDPVDAKEMMHNDMVYSYQGNRNPFIDHPEWIDCVFGSTCGGGGGGPATAWINEFHYDNDGTDTGEFFEIAGTAGLDLSGWAVYGYNGNGGTVYATVNLSGVLPDQQSGFGTLSFAMSGMQNGSPDGLALVDDTGAVVLFISYEGTLTATDGPATGTASTDIGVTEISTTPIGYSLQLAGSGSAYTDFTWQSPQAATSGAVNTGQSFTGGPVNQAPTAVANGPYSGEKGVAVSFSSAGSTDPDGTIVSYAWDFGDGGTSTAANPTHTYTATGTFNVSLTVTDDDGATGNDDTTATIDDTTAPVWINELHYDNDGTDSGEFFEIAGPAGTDLSGWAVYGYNGNGGGTYATVNLSGSLPSQMGGFGTLSFNMAGMQNGAPDGLALVDGTGAVVQFLSYEGSFVATDGAAVGLTSVDIGVSEASTTTVGYSLQLGGTGTTYADFTWQDAQANTSGAVNTGQTLGDGSTGGSWTVITYDDFEAGMGSYRDGGGDMKRYSGGYSHQGSYSADIQDNSGSRSSFYHSSGHDVSGYTDLEVEFWYKAISMENGEDFWVQYWDGADWNTVAVFDKGTDFENGNFYNAVVQIPAGAYNYPTDAKLRFMCDASGNADDVYIDEIEFRGYN